MFMKFRIWISNNRISRKSPFKVQRQLINKDLLSAKIKIIIRKITTNKNLTTNLDKINVYKMGFNHQLLK